MLFFLPYFLASFHGYDHLFKPWVILLLMLLGLVLVFNGPIIPPILLLICPFVLLVNWWHNLRELPNISLRSIFISWRQIPVKYSMVFTFVILLCLYSLYLGTYNSENEWSQIPLVERYSRLLTGFWKLVVYKTGVPILLIGVAVNAIILIRIRRKEKMKSRILLSLSLVFVIGFIYLSLLPFGGYREYRPFIIRDDTAMPFILSLVLWWGASTYYLIHTFSNRRFTYYLLGVIGFLVVFISNDPAHFGHYNCERSAIEELASSNENIVELSSNCPIMGWRIVTKPEASTANCALLKYWGIIDSDKLYYQVKY
jgi:hypothetical protein